MKRPSFQFYPGDWLQDIALRTVSSGARGLWIDIMCLLHQGNPYGYLKVNHKVILTPNLSKIVGLTISETEGWLKELEEVGIFSRDDDGCIFSKRMVRDEEIRQKRASGGILGGNPALKDNQSKTLKVNHKVKSKVDNKVNLSSNLDPNLTPTLSPTLGVTPSSSSSSSSSLSSAVSSDLKKSSESSGLENAAAKLKFLEKINFDHPRWNKKRYVDRIFQIRKLKLKDKIGNEDTYRKGLESAYVVSRQTEIPNWQRDIESFFTQRKSVRAVKNKQRIHAEWSKELMKI